RDVPRFKAYKLIVSASDVAVEILKICRMDGFESRHDRYTRQQSVGHVKRGPSATCPLRHARLSRSYYWGRIAHVRCARLGARIRCDGAEELRGHAPGRCGSVSLFVSIVGLKERACWRRRGGYYPCVTFTHPGTQQRSNATPLDATGRATASIPISVTVTDYTPAPELPRWAVQCGVARAALLCCTLLAHWS
ncbi:hypothetical protein ACLOJK_002272, partial [Asimina triloba]